MCCSLQYLQENYFGFALAFLHSSSSSSETNMTHQVSATAVHSSGLVMSGDVITLSHCRHCRTPLSGTKSAQVGAPLGRVKHCPCRSLFRKKLPPGTNCPKALCGSQADCTTTLSSWGSGHGGQVDSTGCLLQYPCCPGLPCPGSSYLLPEDDGVLRNTGFSCT